MQSNLFLKKRVFWNWLMYRIYTVYTNCIVPGTHVFSIHFTGGIAILFLRLCDKHLYLILTKIDHDCYPCIMGFLVAAKFHNFVIHKKFFCRHTLSLRWDHVLTQYGKDVMLTLSASYVQGLTTWSKLWL